MSYCRFGPDSDVYAYPNIDGTFDCCGCNMLSNIGSKSFDTRLELFMHLKSHEAKGDKVPEYAYERIIEEMDENADLLLPSNPDRAKWWQKPRFWFKRTYYAEVEDTDYVIGFKVNEKHHHILVTRLIPKERI